MIRIILFIFSLATCVVGLTQDFYDGNNTYRLIKGKLYECNCYGHHPHSRLFSVRKSKLFAGKKEYKSDYQSVKLGQLQILIHKNATSQWKEIEDFCIEAIMSVPYDQLNFSSTSLEYINYRDKLIKQLQSIRLLNVLGNANTGIFIEIGSGLIRKTCDGHSNRKRNHRDHRR